MASYNHEDFVADAVASVQDQIYQDFELVVTDDGSKDRTANILRSIQDPRLKLRCFSTNRGASVAANEAIRRSQGEYICILNSDDMFLRHKLQTQVAFLDAHPEVGVVFGKAAFIDEKGSPLSPESTFLGRLFEVSYTQQAEILRHFFFAGNCLCHPSIMLRRECYEKLGLYDERLAQLPDLDMWMRLIPHYRFHIMQEPLMFYRILQNAKNACALRPDSIVRLEWEGVKILRHYLSLPNELFAEVFGPELAALGLNPNGDRRGVLGRICMATNRLNLHRFGLELLHDSLPAECDLDTSTSGFSAADFIRETGHRDVSNSLLRYKVAELEQRLQQIRQYV